MTAKKKKPSSATHTQVAAAATKAAAEEIDDEVIVVCLRIRGGARVSIDVAMSYHNGAHPDCFACRNLCIANGRKH